MTFFLSRFSMRMHANMYVRARVQNSMPMYANRYVRGSKMQCPRKQIRMCARPRVRVSKSARVRKCAGPNSNAYACKYVRARVQNSNPARANMYVRVSRNPKCSRKHDFQKKIGFKNRAQHYCFWYTFGTFLANRGGDPLSLEIRGIF